MASLVASKEKTFITQTKLLYEVTWKTVMQICKKHVVSSASLERFRWVVELSIPMRISLSTLHDDDGSREGGVTQEGVFGPVLSALMGLSRSRYRLNSMDKPHGTSSN